jgi:ADP-ribose pyrophosphatase YjhB (NUDIX family)
MTTSAGGDRRDFSLPKAGASAIVLRERSVLLVRRGKGASRDIWAPPGGHIEFGETARAAAAREVLEETGLTITLDRLLDVHDVILRTPSGEVRIHYLLAVYCCRYAGPDPVAASDAAEARFVDLGSLETLPLTPGAAELIHRAAALLA